MAACSEDYLCGDDFNAVLAIFRSSDYGRNASEAVEKITYIKKIITNAPCALHIPQNISSKAKKQLKDILKFLQKKMQ